MPRETWHVIVEGQPAAAAPGPELLIDGRRVATLVVAGPPPPLGVSFEAALDALAREPRLFIEPDGALVWTGERPTAWQLDGVLHDGAGGLAGVELKGSCPAAAWDALLRAVGWPATPLVVQMVRAGAYLDEATFRRAFVDP